LAIIILDVAIIKTILVRVDIDGPYTFARPPESVVPTINSPKLEICSPASLPL
jgi:hypothetical protein|tara:strand:- start:132 stop:290 length:159 start_codon:yes stop_codon:yes gene_type:complete